MLLMIFAACNETGSNENGNKADNSNPAPPVLSYSIVKIYPHDTSSFTEGLTLV
jgi:glutamine cyclotransferase